MVQTLSGAINGANSARGYNGANSQGPFVSSHAKCENVASAIQMLALFGLSPSYVLHYIAPWLQNLGGDKG